MDCIYLFFIFIVGFERVSIVYWVVILCLDFYFTMFVHNLLPFLGRWTVNTIYYVNIKLYFVFIAKLALLTRQSVKTDVQTMIHAIQWVGRHFGHQPLCKLSSVNAWPANPSASARVFSFKCKHSKTSINIYWYLLHYKNDTTDLLFHMRFFIKKNEKNQPGLFSVMSTYIFLSWKVFFLWTTQ